jgi:hypothetical protein
LNRYDFSDAKLMRAARGSFSGESANFMALYHFDPPFIGRPTGDDRGWAVQNSTQD